MIIFDYLKDLFRGNISLGGAGRSGSWPRIRDAYAKAFPDCAVCGDKKPEIHHVIPFSVDPSQELNPSNFLSLCREHHLLIGHLMSWKSFNKDVRPDSVVWKTKIENRPKVVI